MLSAIPLKTGYSNSELSISHVISKTLVNLNMLNLLNIHIFRLVGCIENTVIPMFVACDYCR